VEEKRQHSRTPLNAHVTYEVSGGEAARDGILRDISMGGVFIEASVVPAFGAKVMVRGRLPGDTQDVELPGVVRWSNEGGFGVQFGLLGARETHSIARILSARR
jgi:type IV pilus assembly protein PilZ